MELLGSDNHLPNVRNVTSQVTIFNGPNNCPTKWVDINLRVLGHVVKLGVCKYGALKEGINSFYLCKHHML